MNILVNSLNYIDKNFELISSLSNYIYRELSIKKFTNDKLARSIKKWDYDISDSIIDFVEDVNNLKTLLRYATMSLYDSDFSRRIKILTKLEIIHKDESNMIQLACQNGHIEIVKLLIQNNVNIHVYCDLPIAIASSNGHIEIVKLLIQNNANINARNDRALELACQSGHIEIVKLLIQNGADIHNHKDVSIKVAYQNHHTEIVELLIQNGAKIEPLKTKHRPIYFIPMFYELKID